MLTCHLNTHPNLVLVITHPKYFSFPLSPVLINKLCQIQIPERLITQIVMTATELSTFAKQKPKTKPHKAPQKQALFPSRMTALLINKMEDREPKVENASSDWYVVLFRPCRACNPRDSWTHNFGASNSCCEMNFLPSSSFTGLLQVSCYQVMEKLYKAWFKHLW